MRRSIVSMLLCVVYLRLWGRMEKAAAGSEQKVHKAKSALFFFFSPSSSPFGRVTIGRRREERRGGWGKGEKERG